MTTPLDLDSLRRDLAGATLEEEPRQATPSPAASAGQGWDALRKELAGATREPEPPEQPAAVSQPSRGFPTARFPEVQPRYDRFGEPINEAARDVETAAGGGFQPSFGGGPPLRSFRTALLGEATTAGRMVLGIPSLLEKGVEAIGAPFTGPEYNREQVAREAAGGAREPQPGVEFARSLDPRAMIDAAMRGDEQAILQLLSMPAIGAVGGEAMRGRPGTGMVRGTVANPSTAEAFTTLGLDPATATAEDVNAAFRQRAQATHPDVPPDVRASRGGPTDQVAAAQQFVRARAARQAALDALQGRAGPTAAPPPPAAEEVQYRAQQAKAGATAPAPAPAPTEPIVTPPPGRGADVLRTMSDEELAAQHPLGATPPVEESGMRPGLAEQQAAFAAEKAERRMAAQPVDVERRGVAAPPAAPTPAPEAIAAPAPTGRPEMAAARPGAPQEVAHPALAPEARITYEAPANDPFKVQKEQLAAKIAPDGPSFAPIARMRQAGATDAAITSFLASKGVGRAEQWTPLARSMFKIPEPDGEPFTEMPVPRETGVVPEAGAPHDQAAVQEGLFGEKTLAGKEQAELMPEAAGKLRQELKATKIAPEEVGRVKREGAEPEGERPMELEAATPRARTGKPLTPDQQVAQHAKLSAQIARDAQIMGMGTYHTTFTDVGGHIGQPGQKITRTVSKGPSYAARGRLRQAERRLKNLEAEMAPADLARARAQSEEVARTAAQETNERLAQGGKTTPEIERAGIQGEATPPEVYQELAREQSSSIPPHLQRSIVDKLIEYGETREELEKRPPLDLANLALEREILSPKEESQLLDAIWPTRGAVPLRGRAQPVDVVPPERGLRDAFRRALYPEKRGPEAVKEARLLRRAIGELRRAVAVDREMLKDARRLPGVDLSTPEGIEWYDRSERPERERALEGLPPELRKVTELIRSMYAPLVRESQALGKISEPIENYLAHGWLRPEDAEKARTAMYEGQSKRPFAGSKAFLKQRSWPLLIDGLKAGAKPITQNGVDLNLWKMQQMRKFIFAEQHLRGAEAEGLAMRPEANERLPAGWRRLQDRTLQQWAMPEPAARILDNYLSSGLRGNEIVDAYLGAANSLVMAKLGLSAFHAAFSTYTGTISRVALAFREARAGRFPLRAPTIGGTIGAGIGALAGSLGGPAGAVLGGMMGSTAGRLLQRGLGLRASYLKPGMGLQLEQRLADMLSRAGGQHQMPEMYLTSTLDAVKQAARRGNLPAAVAKSLLLGLRLTAWPTMQFYVPLIKLGAFSDIMQSELGRLGPLASEAEVDQAAQAVWHSIDNRFGQVSYDTRFWNNAVKQALMGTIQAVGWDAGTIDELGGGVRDALKGKGSHRFDFLVALPLTVALVNILLQYALTGEGPSSLQDLFEPRDGTKDDFGNPNRMTPATYMKDVIGFARHPVRTALGKLNPILGFIQGAITNRDFYGNKWRNEHDPAAVQLKQALDYLRDQFEPISFKNIGEAKRRGVTGARQALPMVGITPASREAVRTPAENMIFDLMRSRAPARTPEQQERSQAKREAAPRVSPDQRLVDLFRHLAPEDRARVFGVANEHEKALFAPYVAAHQRPYRQ